MLLIGDIHITSKIQEKLLKELKEKINVSEEKNVIFLGDFVYHFSYERAALVELFRFFLELAKSGKNLWVMAGNHDWIEEKFVFEEGVLVEDLLSSIGIKFLHKPSVEQIE